MSNQPAKTQAPRPSPGLLRDMINEVRLTWRLLRDPRVPLWLKAIPPAMVLYVVSPIDFIPDFFLGLGQLDDLAAILLGFRTFVAISPPAIVAEHRAAINGTAVNVQPTDVIEGSYKVVDPQKHDHTQ